MSTRSRIAIENEDGTCRSIYCHWDGYPGHNGKILLEEYSDREKLNHLIDLGNLSSLAPNIWPEDPMELSHTFEDPVEGVCVFSGRDRNLTGVEAQTHVDRDSIISDNEDGWEEFFYLYTLKDGWLYTGYNKIWATLTPEVITVNA